MNNEEKILAALEQLQQGQISMSSAIGQLQQELSTVKSDVTDLKTDVAELKSDVAVLKTDVAELKSDVAVLKTDVAELKTDVAVLKSEMEEVKDRLDESKKFQLLVELEWFPKIMGALDGSAGNAEKNAAQDRQIAALRNVADDHGTRIFALERKASI